MFRSISLRLAAPFLLFLLPVAFLLHAVIDFGGKRRQDGAHEIAGVAPVVAVLDLMTELASGADELPLHAAGAGGRRRARRSAADMDDLHRNDAQARQRPALAERVAAGEDVRPISEALDVLAHAVKSLGDASELILDPELATYYLMDILVNRDPA